MRFTLHAALLAAITMGSTANAQVPTAEQVAARYVQARGGSDRLAAIQSLVFRGQYTEGELRLPAVMALMRPYFKLVGDPDQPLAVFAEGYDGSAWEYFENPGIAIRTVGAAASASRHGTSIGGSLAEYHEHGWTIQMIGRDSVGGRPAWRVRVRMSDGFEEDQLVDASTWLLLAKRKTMPIHAFGEAVRSEERLSDYRPVAGVLFPFRSQEVEIATGRVLNEMQWTAIEANRPLERSVFSPPRIEHTPLPDLLQHLYAERSDLEAVRWSYREFRAAHPDVDTHSGVEVIGYQMLKMGDETNAIELLALNASDYPHVASAAFGLGRAYQAAGRTELARREYQRALAIDPNYTRAKDALRSLR